MFYFFRLFYITRLLKSVISFKVAPRVEKTEVLSEKVEVLQIAVILQFA